MREFCQPIIGHNWHKDLGWHVFEELGNYSQGVYTHGTHEPQTFQSSQSVMASALTQIQSNLLINRVACCHWSRSNANYTIHFDTRIMGTEHTTKRVFVLLQHNTWNPWNLSFCFILFHEITHFLILAGSEFYQNDYGG